MATALRALFSRKGKGASRFMGQMVAWYEPLHHSVSRTIAGTGTGYPNKVHSGICLVDGIGFFLFRCHAYGVDSTRAAIESFLCFVVEIACCGVLLGSDTGFWYRGRSVEARCSLHPAFIRLASDKGANINLDGDMVVSDSTTSDCSIPGTMVLALLSGADKPSERALRRKLVGLVTWYIELAVKNVAPSKLRVSTDL